LWRIGEKSSPRQNCRGTLQARLQVRADCHDSQITRLSRMILGTSPLILAKERIFPGAVEALSPGRSAGIIQSIASGGET